MTEVKKEPGATSKRQRRRLRLVDFQLSYWKTHESSEANSVEATVSLHPEDTDTSEPPPVSEHSVCTTCGKEFTSFLQQRIHFKTDVHKYNAKRKVRNLPPVTEDQFEQLDDLGSVESLSGSESGSEDEEAPSANSQTTRKRLTERLEFRNPGDRDTYVVLHRASLPDASTLDSLQKRGSWAVIMAGGGHFVAALWDVNGTLQKHKTFHRYTSRRKQGGSQAAADEARGNANRIRSAGATLRRHGEQALQNEVHELLKIWRDSLSEAQCIYVRASQREKRDLLVGWHGSPLKKPHDEGRVRNIPVPTRRATLKEAARIYEELISVTISPNSLVTTTNADVKAKPAKTKTLPQATKSTSSESKSTVKGTDHLKKRDLTKKNQDAASHVEEEKEAVPEREKNEEVDKVLHFCLHRNKEKLAEVLANDPAVRQLQFPSYYFTGDERFDMLDGALGLVGVAAVCASPDLVEWLLENGVSPAIGVSPYLATKSKVVRTTLRKYWGNHPDQYDYAAARIPAPLSEGEIQAAAERDRAKRRKDRDKKKEKARERAEAAKPPEQRARELRAMAAEARFLGNRCASCRKALQGITPFERLAYKYCSTECVSKHRSVLSKM